MAGTLRNRRLLIFALILFTGLMAGSWPTAAASPGNIQVYSTPHGNDVCLDSTTNSGNCQAFDSDGFTEFFGVVGESYHTVSVYLDGYQTYTTTVYVSPDEDAVVHAVLQPNPAPTASGFWQGLIAAIRNLIPGAGSQTPVFAPAGRSGTNGGSGNVVTGTMTSLPESIAPAQGPEVIAAYFYLFDDSYDAAMSVQDTIPWKKINRLYIAFATVQDGVLTDLPAGSSSEDIAKREETEQKIRNVVALCRQGNPDAEIFITSNFGGDMDDQYLLAAQDPKKFADSVVDYLRTYDLDGYDMDWESRRIDDYAPQLTTLLSACHVAFGAAGNNPHDHTYTLTHTVWPGLESPETVAGLAASVDDLNLMTYGPGQGYDLASYADAYHQAGFPYEKMIGGVESEFGYEENGGPDTQTSVAAKCDYVKENHLAGLFEWRMDNDMRTPDGVNPGGPPTFQVTSWMHDCLSG